MASLKDIKYLDLNGLEYFWGQLQTYTDKWFIKKGTPITYSELKTLRDESKLVPGCKYRITDYECTTTTSGTKSAGHQFDIIVEALDVNVLSEEAKAIQHSGDTYFSNCDLNAWELWYCLDNDTSRFGWADTANGKGVIYRMIDDKNNDCPYDFKNITFNDYYTFSYTVSGVLYDGTTESRVVNCYGNTIKGYIISRDNGANILNNIVFKNTSFENKCYKNSFGNNCYNNSFEYNCYSNSFGDNCHDNSFGDTCYSNSFGNGCSGNSFGSNCHDNSFGNYCYDNSFGNSCHSNRFGSNCSSNTFGSECHSNTFGEYCRSNSFGMNCNNNSFGNGCDRNSFGNSCESNSFGDSCYSISFGKSSSGNSFGNGCGNNSFGTNCEGNSFGDYCCANSFGQDYSYNSFGEYCGRNSFGDYCHENSFKNNCSENTFKSNCQNNSFGNGCWYNHFGTNCSSNSFGNDCRYNFFRRAASTSSSLRNYCRYNIFDSGCAYNVIWDDQTASSNQQIQNIHIKSGVCGTSNAYNYINITKLQSGNKIIVTKKDDGTIIQYTEIVTPSELETAINNIEIPSPFNPLIYITYSELKALKDNSKLVPGQKYRITDYETKANGNNVSVAGNNFDIIITAVGTNELSEIAEAILSDASSLQEGNHIINSSVISSQWTDVAAPEKVKELMNNQNPIVKCVYWTRSFEANQKIKVKVNYTEGSNRLNIVGVEMRDTSGNLIEGDYHDYHLGHTGNEHVDNIYYVTSPGSGSYKIYILIEGTTEPITASCNIEVIGLISYFGNCNLGAWDIKYCLDNDTSRFNWVNENSKGAIYYMKDEFGNEAPYDFKNIKFYGYFTFDYFVDGVHKDGSVHYPLYCYENKMGETYDGAQKKLSLTFFKNTTNTSSCYHNEIGVNCFNTTFGDSCYLNIMKSHCHACSFGNNCNSNILGNYCNSITFGNNCNGNILGDNCSGNGFGAECVGNTFGRGCIGNTFGANCQHNNFEDSCSLNNFESYCHYNIFGDRCSNNVFKSYCANNTFKSFCAGNEFGQYCQYDIFDDYCQSNNFGDYCQSNKFGIYVANNTFGDYCLRFKLGNKCQYNKFTSDASGDTLRNYWQCISLEDNCSYNIFWNADTSNNYIQNIHVYFGVSGTSDSRNVVNIEKISATNTITVTKKDDGTIIQYTEIPTSETLIEATYSELKALRDNSELIPGYKYRITDYECVVDSTYIEMVGGMFELPITLANANHQFDIIVEALDVNVLSEEAKAIQHEGDTYFSNCNLNAWELKYCLDNDNTRFHWINEGSKGVVYHMVDDVKNECWYDFKNILFVPSEAFAAHFFDNIDYNLIKDGVYTFTFLDNDVIYDGSVQYPNYCYGNIINGIDYLMVSLLEEFINIPNATIFLNNCGAADMNVIYDNKIGEANLFNVFNGGDCLSNDIGCYFMLNKAGLAFSGNKIGSMCLMNSFGDDCNSNSFGSGCTGNTFGESCYYNSFGNECSSNSFGSNCYYNSFGNHCTNNSFGDSCYYNSFGNYCYSNTFGSNCSSNSFGNVCYNNSFEYDCRGNSFGNNCYSNSFGSNCSSNSFGNHCYSNSFGDSCYYNSFGSNCIANTFGSGCQSNSFGNYCEFNSFGDYCQSNSFGNDCEFNSFGDYCQSNSFGNDCERNSFRVSASNDSSLRNYCRYNIFDNGCSYNTIWNDQTSSNTQQIQNIHVKSGTRGTSSAYNFINITELQQEYQLNVAKNSSGDIKVYCEADLIQ